MTRPPTADTQRMTFRLDNEIADLLREYAKSTRRTLNAAGNQLLGDALHDAHRRRERLAAPRPGPVPPQSDARVCSSCDRGYYGPSCPVCEE